VQLICHRTLVRGFLKLGIFRAGTDETALLVSGVSAAFFPHGVGHSLGLDVHDVPSASRPTPNPTIARKNAGSEHEKFYDYLRLRLPLEVGMVVVRLSSCYLLRWPGSRPEAVTNIELAQTVEPGIYFHQHLLTGVRNSDFIDHNVLSRYELVGGVRIEDVVLITSDGAENFTTVRSDVEWIEGVCSGRL
jgi:Xaa-Pro dipeptidase